MRINRQLIWAIGFACGTSCMRTVPIHPPPPPTSPSFIDTITRIKQSVLPIACVRITDGKGEVLSVEGTGFVVGTDGTFITADHVIASIIDHGRQTPCPLAAFYLPQSGNWNVAAEHGTFQVDFFAFFANACRRDPGIDVASCRSPNAIPATSNILPVAFENRLQPDGTPIAFTAFPLQSKIPLSSLGAVSAYAGAQSDNRGPREILMDKTAWPGASGSPIYTIDGKVVGLMRLRGINEGSGRSIGTPSRLIQEFLGQAAPPQQH